MRVIAALMGHVKLVTSAIYTRVATTIEEVTGALEYLIPRLEEG